MRVVWLCHFANQEIKDFFNTPYVKEMAPWINSLIELFKERNDIELHIVAPNVFNNTSRNFEKEGIYYHFYSHSFKYIPKKLKTLFTILFGRGYSHIQTRIRKIIDVIKPDIVHLHGAENPYYSVGILPIIERYPVLVTIQGFIRNSVEQNMIVKKRIQIEEEILKSAKHIGIRTQEMKAIASELNPGAKLHFHNYPLTEVHYIKVSSIKPTFDIIFFARVCKDKGIEDLLEAVSVVKKVKPDVSLHVIGGTSKYYLQHLRNLTQQFDIEQNVKFLGFFATQQEIYKHALNAKICVLPTYHDIIPGTILESMLMKLPVIAYAVGGIPELNYNGETVVLVEKQNIKQLAHEIVNLLLSENKRSSLAELAYKQVIESFDNNNVVNDIIKTYNSVLSTKNQNYNSFKK